MRCPTLPKMLKYRFQLIYIGTTTFLIKVAAVRDLLFVHFISVIANSPSVNSIDVTLLQHDRE